MVVFLTLVLVDGSLFQNFYHILTSTKFIDVATKLPEVHAKGLEILEKFCHTIGLFSLSKCIFTSSHGHNQEPSPPPRPDQLPMYTVPSKPEHFCSICLQNIFVLGSGGAVNCSNFVADQNCTGSVQTWSDSADGAFAGFKRRERKKQQ